MYDPRNTLAQNVGAELEKHFGDKLYRTIIPRNMRLAEAPSHGVPALHARPQSKGAQAYLALAGEMLRRMERAPRAPPRPRDATARKASTMIRPKGLGRGLDALLAGIDDADAGKDSLQTLADRSRCGPASTSRARGWTRRRSTSSPHSIREQGVMQPMLVRPVDGGRFEIIAGERRWRAAQRAGLTRSAGAGARPCPTRRRSRSALIENIQREDLNPLEEAQGLARLIDEFGLTHDAAAKAVGRSRSAVTNLLRLTRARQAGAGIPAVGRARHGPCARAARRCRRRSRPRRRGARRRAAAVGARNRAAGACAAGRRPGQDASARGAAAMPTLARLETEIAEALGAKVRIEPRRNGAGRVVIGYSSLDSSTASSPSSSTPEIRRYTDRSAVAAQRARSLTDSPRQRRALQPVRLRRPRVAEVAAASSIRSANVASATHARPT